MKLKILITFCCILLIIPNVLAGNEIIDYLSNVIYQDCKTNDIDVSPIGLVYIATNESLNVLKWPYHPPDVRKVIELIIQNEPYSVFVGKGGNLGNKLLSCGDDELIVNFYTYKWKGERVDPFQYNFNQIIQSVDKTVTEKVNQIAVQGSGNIVDVRELKQNINNLNQTFQTSLESNFLKIKSEISDSKISFIDTINFSVIFYVSLTIIINIVFTVGLICLEYKLKIIETALAKFNTIKRK